MRHGQDITDTHPIVLFDGVCNLCNGAVQFIIARDRKAVVRFASLQSDVARYLLFGLNISLGHGTNSVTHVGGTMDSLDSGDETTNLITRLGDTIVLLDGDGMYTESTAVLRITRYLSWPYPILGVLMGIPRPLRDGLYRWVARNRYRWFGKRASCMVPTADIRERFLE